MTLEEMIEAASAVTERSFSTYGSVKAHWYVITRSGERMLLPSPPRASKDEIAWAVRQVLTDVDAVQVVFVDEAWQVLCETPAQEKAVDAWYGNHDTLEGFPGRLEVVMFQGEDADGHVLTGQREIQRGQGWVSLAPLKLHKPVASQGRYAGWLAGRGTKH